MLAWIWICLTAFVPRPDTYYQSPALKGVSLAVLHGDYSMADDAGKVVPITAYTDSSGQLFWYRRIFTEVCQTGECKPIDIGIYWQCAGKYMGLEVYGEPLTKTDHTVFTVFDYQKLEILLKDEWSDLREYRKEELVEGMDTTETTLDGVTGATRQEVAKVAVKDAVYTCYTIWHLIHVGESEQLALLTLNRLRENASFRQALIHSDNRESRDFMLNGLISGQLNDSPEARMLVLTGLASSGDLAYKNLSLKALRYLDVNDPELQRSLSKVYPRLQLTDKMPFLTALSAISALDKDLSEAFAQDLKSSNEWLLAKVQEIFNRIGGSSSR